MSNHFDFQKLHRWAESQEPVFVVGPERSGTSMMFRTIVSHPDFCSFDNATVETFCLIRPQQLMAEASSANYEMRVYLGKEYDSFTEAVSPIKSINRVCDQTEIPRGYHIEQRRMVWNRRNYRELLRAFFYFSWINLGRKRLAEKTPAHVRSMSEIIDCFPKAKILICLRDPLEVIASHRKRLAKEIELGKKPDDPSLEWLSKTTPHYLGYFEHVNRLIGTAQRKFPNSVLLVPYKKVTTEQGFLQRIFEFVGADPSEVGKPEAVQPRTPEWDPLLSSMPRHNQIDAGAWMTRDEIALVKRASGHPEFRQWQPE